MKTIAERLRHARELRGWTQTQLAVAADLSQSTIGNIESGTREGRGSLPRLAKALGVSHDWLSTGEGDIQPPAPFLTNNLVIDRPFGRPTQVIHMLSAAASMGTGTDQPTEDVIVGALHVSPSWLRDHLKFTKLNNLRFIHAYGDSMSPTLNSGDVVLVDAGVNEVLVDGVYVLQAHGRLFVKRVAQRMDGRFEVSSDNPMTKTSEILNGDHQIEVLGRVIWAWNGKKL